MEYLIYVLIGFLVFYAFRVVKGPSIWDRLMGMNLMTTKTIVLILMFASFNDLAFLLDLAIIYTITGFIGTIFISLFLFDRMKRRE